MLIAYVPFLVMLIGLLLWALAATRSPPVNGIVARAGEYMFAIGLLWTVYSYVGRTTKLFG